ncbi:hypothetical protein [Candidatus Nitrosotenuis uzonensis]|uniref:hypothetical protein n=1 Tax=Candidatus Nitrosotenuis uzonensis TaxID=1407055 RepID=UPI0012DFCA51|nr:hypothetical protein [Candidatus Nitrosotenuis uzonensis]
MDKYEFDKKIAMTNVGLAVLLTVGGVLSSAGVAFLIAGAIEANHGIDLPEGKSQDRILDVAFRFLGLGVEIFALGLLIIAVSGTAIPLYVKKLSNSLKSDVDKSDSPQKPDHQDSLKINQQEEIKNVDARLEIENLKLELINLKIEVATQKFEEIKSKTNTNNRKKDQKNK